MFSALFNASLRATGLTALLRRFRNAGVVLCYHNLVADDREARIGDPGLHAPLERFRRQLGWLAAEYEIICLREFVDRLSAGRPLRRCATITFDDAYSGVFEYAWPVLRSLGVPATVFVVTGAPSNGDPFWWDHPAVRRADTPDRRRRWLGTLCGDGSAILGDLAPARPWSAPTAHRPASWEVLARAARSGIALGAHSTTHRALPQLSDPEILNELVASREVLARHTGATAEFFSYPYGLWDGRVRQAAQAAGYRAACALDYGLVCEGADRWALPRVNVPATIGAAAFEVWTSGLRPHWTPST